MPRPHSRPWPLPRSHWARPLWPRICGLIINEGVTVNLGWRGRGAESHERTFRNVTTTRTLPGGGAHARLFQEPRASSAHLLSCRAGWGVGRQAGTRPPAPRGRPLPLAGGSGAGSGSLSAGMRQLRIAGVPAAARAPRPAAPSFVPALRLRQPPRPARERRCPVHQRHLGATGSPGRCANGVAGESAPGASVGHRVALRRSQLKPWPRFLE